ncbi:hypothetical protein [Rhodopirellula baltica]|uniref:hypothetical protein n=1 Tax=Rhodopirellula baltica TaxID=265606 RepID=UPI0002EEE378|nr:hypothetical protein [Rhodopirellula baltica]
MKVFRHTAAWTSGPAYPPPVFQNIAAYEDASYRRQTSGGLNRIATVSRKTVRLHRLHPSR